MKNILLLLFVSISCLAQLDITKRQVTVDSLKARTDSIYIESPASYNGYEVATVKDAAASGIGTSLDGEILYNNAGTVDGSPMTTDGTDITVNNDFYINGNKLYIEEPVYSNYFDLNLDPNSSPLLDIYMSDASGVGNSFGSYAFGSKYSYLQYYNDDDSTEYLSSGATGSQGAEVWKWYRSQFGRNGYGMSGIINIPHKIDGQYYDPGVRLFYDSTYSGVTVDYDITNLRLWQDGLHFKHNDINVFRINEDTTNIFNNLVVDYTLQLNGDFKNIPPHASFYRNTDTTISANQNIWYKLRMTTTKDIVGFTKQKDTIQFTKAGSYVIDFTISFSGVNNEVWEIAIFKNNIMEEPSQLRYTSTSDVGNMSCPVYVTSDGNDWFAFKIRNTTDNDDPTLKRVSIIITTQHLD